MFSVQIEGLELVQSERFSKQDDLLNVICKINDDLLACIYKNGLHRLHATEEQWNSLVLVSNTREDLI